MTSRDFRDIQKEYNLKLRWVNGGGDEHATWNYTFYLENLSSGKHVKINGETLHAIGAVSTNAFRHDINVYDNYIKLFDYLGIKKLPTLKDICNLKGISGNKLNKLTNIPRMTLSDLMNGKTEFKNTSCDNALKIAKALDMSVEDLYFELYESNIKDLLN